MSKVKGIRISTKEVALDVLARLAEKFGEVTIYHEPGTAEPFQLSISYFHDGGDDIDYISTRNTTLERAIIAAHIPNEVDDEQETERQTQRKAADEFQELRDESAS